MRAVNAGGVVPITEVAQLPLDRDDLLREARARLGLADGGAADFGDDDFVEPLDLALQALEEEAALTVLGRWLTRRYLLRLLVVRLQLVAYVRADPAVVDEEIRRPLFVTGAPRTGTTILHAMLACDPGVRVPEGWELLRPVPPPAPGDARHDVRVRLADAELRLPQVVTGAMDAIHEYGGRMPKECLSAMSFAFRSEELVSRYQVPSYQTWLERCDMRPAYEMHRLVLQVLQRRQPPLRWVLKSPVHLHSIPTLLAVYPDARLVVTHRDPLTVLPSVTSLVATLRAAFSDDVDFAAIGAYHARLYAGSLDRLVDHAGGGVLDPGRVHHGHYARFVDDPLGAVAELYAHFDEPLTDVAAERMRALLDARPQGRHGEHRYAWDDLGLDRDATGALFARYRDRFGVPVDGRP